MKPLFAFIFFFSLNAFAIDLGDGSLGNCTEASLSLGGGTFNCSTLTISGNRTFNTGASAVIVKVLGNVIINGGTTLTLNGGNGNNGDGTPTNDKTGGLAGAGGFAGGSYSGTSFNGSSGQGAGGGGGCISSDVTAGQDGSGGAGGSNGTLGGAGSDGTSGTTQNLPFSTPGTVGPAQSGFIGGAGGGAGGRGTDSISSASSAGSGAGGGGALRIVAGGTITVTGNLTADGGTGGNGDNATGFGDGGSGAGGGGAGGTVLLESLNAITITGTVSLTGGSGGTAGDGTGGVGGAGGLGRLILSTPSLRNIDISGATLANGLSATYVDLEKFDFDGDIATSCGTITGENGSGPGSFFLSFILGLLILGLKVAYNPQAKAKV